MTTTPTDNYDWQKPDVGSEIDTWGERLNELFDAADADLKTVEDKADEAKDIAETDASTTQKGRVELATEAEVLAGVATDKAVTPASLGGAAALFSGEGYYRFPGGLIVQWGQANTVGVDSTVGVTFPMAFPTACLRVITGTRVSSFGSNNDCWSQLVGTPSTTGCTVANQSGNSAVIDVPWVAIGH